MQNEGPLPDIRPWTGVNTFSYFVAAIPMLRVVAINKTKGCSKALTLQHPEWSLFSHTPKLLHANDSHISVSIPDSFHALPRLTYPSAYWTVPSGCLYTSQMEQACPRELRFPSCPVPHPPKCSGNYSTETMSSSSQTTNIQTPIYWLTSPDNSQLSPESVSSLLLPLPMSWA